jgi:protein SCO1
MPEVRGVRGTSSVTGTEATMMRPGPTARLRRQVLVTLSVVLLAAACGPASSTSLSAQGLSRAADGWYGLPLQVERTLPDTTLLTTSGVPFTLSEELAGTPTLLFFGYSSCPDICPIHLAAISNAMEQTRTTYDRLQVVFVSVDPERDTPERIDEFLSYFNTRIIGLHGDLDEVADALARLDLPGPIVEGPDPRGEGVLIGHPAQVIGFDAAGNARRVWPFGTRRADWVSDIPRIVREWS